jgi:hypothetical protein
MTRLPPAADERGTTLVELMVGLGAGLVILSTLTMVIMVTLHGSAKVSARVDATQRARFVLTRIMEELHSACVTPKIAPVLSDSTGTSLSFIHSEGNQGNQVAPNPTHTVISLASGVLSQTDYVATGGVAPNWTYSTTPSTRKLLTGVSPVAPSSSIFSYFEYKNGALSGTPQTTPLGTGAGSTIEVRVAFTASPGSTPVTDKGATASIQDSAVLRLTPPSYAEGTVSLPCQ